MNALVDLYRAAFKVSMTIQLQYRIALVIWMIGLVLEPVIYLVVWTTVAHSNGGSVGTYTTSDFAAYFIVMMLVNHATFTWIMFEFDNRIRQGIFSPLLLRPVHPIHRDLAENLTYKLLTLIAMLPTAAVLTIAFHPRLHVVAWALLAFIPALTMAIALRFLIEWALALVAFWTSRANAVNEMYYVLVLFLSGQVAPLQLFPEPIRILAAVLPFRWMIAFPVELMLGRLSTQEAMAGFAAQGVWLVLGLGLLALMWRQGVRRYSAVGI